MACFPWAHGRTRMESRTAYDLRHLAEMARPKRFELLTPRFVVWCSIQLSYGRMPEAAKRANRQGISYRLGLGLARFVSRTVLFAFPTGYLRFGGMASASAASSRRIRTASTAKFMRPN